MGLDIPGKLGSIRRPMMFSFLYSYNNLLLLPRPTQGRPSHGGMNQKSSS